MTSLANHLEQVVPDWALSHADALRLGLAQGGMLNEAAVASGSAAHVCLIALERLHADLQQFSEDWSFSRQWLRRPNTAPLCGGFTPIDVLKRGNSRLSEAIAGDVRGSLGYD
ncbi:MAG: hypothetical protein C0423_09055 [Methylibium sp.]|nr:hypothetical protein [Methylibium sp.]